MIILKGARDLCYYTSKDDAIDQTSLSNYVIAYTKRRTGALEFLCVRFLLVT